MSFFGGASSRDRRALEGATRTAEDRFGGSADWAADRRGSIGQFEDDIRTRGTERGAHMWGQLWGDDGAFSGGGGGGGGPRYRGDPNSIWGTLRDTGDLTGGDWEKSRGVYHDFADTGGWNEDDKRDFRARAIAGTDMYDPRADAASRVQGGWGAGTSGSELARQKAISEMRRRGSFEAESDLASSIREGRRWGAESTEGLGGRVQEGRIAGQSELDRERRERHSRARARAAAGSASRRADQNALWGRSMQLMGFDQSRLGRAGADLAYDQAAQSAAGGAMGARTGAYDRQARNRGWGSQLAGLAGAGLRSAAGLGWSPLGSRPEGS